MDILVIVIITIVCSAAGCYAGYTITSKIFRNKKATLLKERENSSG